MKKILTLLLIFIGCNVVMADSINPAVYKTMSNESYAQNYKLNTQTSPVPYWKIQSNPTTRNKSFINDQHQGYNQDLNQYKYNMKLMRGY